MTVMTDAQFLAEMEPVVAELLERHYENTTEWHPHTLVPWGRGEDFEPGYEWSPEESSVSPEVRSALFVNLLTEDNLPYYFRDIERVFGREGAWGEWVKRWTAEEGRHATVIRDYLTVTRAIDPVELERGRMAQMSGGQVPEPPNFKNGLIYVTLQELATRISHRNTGAMIGDRAGYDIMRRVAMDENHHFLFYRDMAKVALERDPSGFVQAIEDEVTGFAMPGTGIPEFDVHSRAIALAGIYNFQVHYEKILEPIVLTFWDLPHIEGLTPEAQASQERTMKYLEKSAKVAERFKQRMAQRKEKYEALNGHKKTA